MTATATNGLDAGRLVTAMGASDLGARPPEDFVPNRGAASANVSRLRFARTLGSALACGERAVSGVMRRLGDARARRLIVRDLRRLGRSRLADVGIEPDRIEDVADALIAARRRAKATHAGR